MADNRGPPRPVQTGRPPRSRDNSAGGGVIRMANPTQASLDADGGAHTTLPMNPMYPPPRYFPGSPHAEGATLYESPKAGSIALQRHGFSQEGGSGTPGQGNAAQYKRTVQYGNRQPLRKDASWFACCVFLGYLAAVAYYMYVRIAFTLDFKDKWYSIIILVVEFIGVTAVIPYALINCIHTHPAGSPGLPIDDGMTQPDKTFHVRIMVPCYKEPLEVISATVAAAMEADLPPGVTRTLYLCDDGKDPVKKAWLEEKYGPRVPGVKGSTVYVSGRQRAKGEINGKSANLNNCLKNIVYPQYVGNPAAIPKEEVLVVFDADMQAKPYFFCKILEVLCDDSVALCLSPQAFSNVDPAIDIFNNTNQQFWEYVLPGLDALGYIACTGTNFCIRSQALGSVGWFPEYCITEDYALSMELKAGGFKGRYLAEYLAVGEAPEELRNVLRQRSRWTKGHMQVFFSSRNPMIRWRLPLLHKWLYNNGTWSYFCTVITTWTFLLVPFLSLMFQLQPVKFSREFATAATVYLALNMLVMNYFHVADHMRGLWMANVSNYLLCFTYSKAIINVLAAKLHLKQKAGFKATEKTQGGGAAGASAAAMIQSRLLNRLNSLTKGFNQATVPQLYSTPPVPTSVKQKKEEDCIPDKVMHMLYMSICTNTLILGLHQVFVIKRLTAWLALPMLWSLYNMVPPVLFFGHITLSTNGQHNLCFWLNILQMLCGLGAIVCLWFVVPIVY